MLNYHIGVVSIRDLVYKLYRYLLQVTTPFKSRNSHDGDSDDDDDDEDDEKEKE
jgi:hypothetical protein